MSHSTMIRSQWIAVITCVIGTFVLYFLFDIKPESFESVELDRKLSFVQTDINLMIRDARLNISDVNKLEIDILNKAISEESDSTNTEKMEELAGVWFQLGYPAISGHYASKIAEVKQTDDAWGIAGTTFAIALKQDVSDEVKDYAKQNAIESFEKAISMNPEQIDHKLNRALVYTDMPPEDNPMKGVMQILALNKANPEHIGVLNQLARLGIKTNQFEKAVERLEKVLSLQPENKNALCMLAVAYQGLNELNMAEEYRKKCAEANKDI